MMTSAECAATVIGGPEGHSITGLLGGTGGQSFVGGVGGSSFSSRGIGSSHSGGAAGRGNSSGIGPGFPGAF